jgi:hypothetical protein
VKNVSDEKLGEIIEKVEVENFSICDNGGYREVTEDEIVTQKIAYKNYEKSLIR